jgi:probable F420-dependent oxidoreductase
VATVNIGIRIPSVQAPDTAELRRFVERVEELGFHSVWAGDHLFHHTDVLQPIDLLTWVAALTSRVKLGTTVVNAAYLHPALLAKQASTLDYLSDGRFRLGISIGGNPLEYASLGVSMKTRVSRLMESIEVMRRLWREDNVEHQGRHFTITGGNLRPKPKQAGGVPVYVAAREDPMLDRLATVADGFCASGHYTKADFERGVNRIRETARVAGRDPEALDMTKVHSISVAATREEARSRAQQHWGEYYGPAHDIEKATTYGTPDDCVAELSFFKKLDAPAVTLCLEPTSMSLQELELIAEVKQALGS